MGNYGRQWDRVTLLGLTKCFRNGNPLLYGDLEYRQVPDPNGGQFGSGMRQNYVLYLFFYCKAMIPLYSYGPRVMTAAQDKSKGARRPVSRVLSPPRPLNAGDAMDGHSSGTPVTERLTRPTRTAARKPACPFRSRRNKSGVPSLLGLAPGGVYLAVPVAGNAVRSYRTLSPLPTVRPAKGPQPGPAVCFLWHCP
jgi:hypothetical protein